MLDVVNIDVRFSKLRLHIDSRWAGDAQSPEVFSSGV